MHLVLCILLTGDIASNPGARTSTNQNRNYEFGPSIVVANMMSLVPKIDELRCFINTNPDLNSLTETWTNESVSNYHFQIPGFKLLLGNRTCGPHGGVGLYIRDSIMVKP